MGLYSTPTADASPHAREEGGRELSGFEGVCGES
jgi:hypothetical protein